MSAQPTLLTDEQMRQFITEGYLILKADFPQSFHESLFNQLKAVYETEGNPGNNILPRVSELQKVFDHPVIRGALTSTLGPDYLMHPHRHGHYNASPTAGGWHKDSYWGYQKRRNHRPWWAMIFYYPQDVSLELGPTGVLPGTQNYQSRVFDGDETPDEVKSVGKAGTFALVRYDIWHRANANISGQDRFMLKFQFVRISAPTGPTWNNVDPDWQPPQSFSRPIYPHDAQWVDTWNWLMGRSVDANEAYHIPVTDLPSLYAQLQSEDRRARVEAVNALGMAPIADAATVQALNEALDDSFEPVALNAAYGLARKGEAGIQTLIAALSRGEAVARNAGYGLSMAGLSALDPLTALLGSDPSDDAAASAAFALGEIGSEQALPYLASLMDHASARVRQNACEAIGHIGVGTPEALGALRKGLKDADEQVRFMTALSFTRLRDQAADAVPDLVAALDDENRYVRANAVDALTYIGTQASQSALLSHLRSARWCPLTTPQSTY